MSKASVHLIVPGILDSLKAQQGSTVFKSLQRLLCRSDKMHTPVSGYYSVIAHQFDWAHSEPLPIAAVSYYAETGQKDTITRMHINPVHILADKDRLILQGESILSLQKHEAEDLLSELNKTYQDDQFVFQQTGGHSWYLSLPETPDCLFHSLEDVLGRSVEPFLPAGNDKLFWHRFLNEVQMLFHASEVNHKRLEKGHIPVNSVWCWGCGNLPDNVSSQWDYVVSNHPFVKGLALLADVKTKGLPGSAESFLNEDMTGDCLLVFDSSEQDILALDPEHHQQRLNAMEANWFSPLMDALKKGRLGSIRLSDTSGNSYYLKKSHLRRFWRN